MTGVGPDAGPDAGAVARLATDLDRLVPPGERLGIALSGGADSSALMLLATAARPGLVEAVTVDHRLRPESTRDARAVAAICVARNLPHTIIDAPWDQPPRSNVEAAAREMRYIQIAEWAERRGLAFVATGHHANDQAETLLMRLARGAGLAGMSGIREKRRLGRSAMLVRPLLRWDAAVLLAIVLRTGMPIIPDTMNEDDAFDRVRLRDALREAGFGEARRYAATARHLAEAEEALAWMTDRLFRETVRRDGDALLIPVGSTPPELVRRLLVAGFEEMGRPRPRGPELAEAMGRVAAGARASLGGLIIDRENEAYRLGPEPPRRNA